MATLNLNIKDSIYASALASFDDAARLAAFKAWVKAVTVRALQRRVGSYPDGAWGPDTTRALQRYLNAR